MSGRKLPAFSFTLCPFPFSLLLLRSAFALLRVSLYNPSLARSAVALSCGFAPTFYFGAQVIFNRAVFEHKGA
jgi:hypothetical protein